tara:strand:+ start:10525 stop:11979 length:1455 start_codon:yes stop_codon:yes gene_type:complete
MAKILFLYPNKQGHGITVIWIPSHSAVLKSKGHSVELFDGTFFKNWTVDETAFNTENKMYKPSDYSTYVSFSSEDIHESLQSHINKFQPDIIFWSALSSHIHGEGEYVSIEYGYELIKKVSSDAIKIAGGLQATAAPDEMCKKFPNVDYFISGESEFVIAEVADRFDQNKNFDNINGLLANNKEPKYYGRQDIISNMDVIPPYDYGIFDDQTFFRPYNGKVVRAADIELSRGCPYTCSYCVETVIQKYYGFNETGNNGVLKKASKYLRNKSSSRIFLEISSLYKDQGVTYFRCQDTNFLSINQKVLKELANLIDESNLPIFLYIETRPETINERSIELLKKLRVDGVGMGLELASESFRKSSLNRFPSQEKIIRAFKLLRKAGIKRTTYNILGLPNETEEMIHETIEFNRLLDPDNMTVSFFSPYLGTPEQQKAQSIGDFSSYEFNMDDQVRTVSKSNLVVKKKLEFYKRNFVKFVREGIPKNI